MGFNFPAPPAHDVFPHAAHLWANGVIWAVAAVLVVFALKDASVHRSWLGLVLLAGGALAYFNEPVDDILGLVWHPRIHQDTVLNTIGPIPMWGLPTYIIFFGGIPWLLLRELRRHRFTLKAFWIGVALTFAADLAIELPLLQTNLYSYWGYVTPPLTIARFPLYWLLINTTGPIFCAAILFAVPQYFTGWRRVLLVLVPVVADASCSIAVGLPVYTTLHAPHVGEAVRWAGALLSIGIGLVILDALSRWILARTATYATSPASSGLRSRATSSPQPGRSAESPLMRAGT
jgi:hypothetical protein